MRPLAALQLRALLIVVAFLCGATTAGTVVMMLFWRIILPLLVVAELLIFPGIFLHKYWQFNQQPHTLAPLGYDPRPIFERFTKEQHKLSKYLCIKDMMQRWFWGVPIDQIKRGNVAELLAYGFMYKTRGQLVSEGLGHLPDEWVLELEAAWGFKFEEGYTPGLPFMAHLWQGLRCHYRPMLFYMGIELLFLLKHMLMLGAGFTAHNHCGYTYYTHSIHPEGQQRQRQQQQEKMPSEQSLHAAKAPVLFLHGVGIGLLPYFSFVIRLVASGLPVLAVESRHLGMRWVSHVPGEDDVVAAVVEIMDREQLSAASVVGHSYGTFMASRLVQLFPQRVQSLALIDPVCFIMFSGKLILNFVYQPHTCPLTTWLVARDIHHAAAVCRGFFWSQLNLWPDQLPDKTLVVLSGRDELVPVQETIVMLKAESTAQIMYHGDHQHADFVKDLTWQDKVAEQVAALATFTEVGQQVHVDAQAGLPVSRDEGAVSPVVKRRSSRRAGMPLPSKP